MSEVNMNDFEKHTNDEILIIKHLSKQASKEEDRLLQEKLAINEEFQINYFEMKEVWETSQALAASETINVDKAILNFNAKTNKRKEGRSRKLIIRFSQVAALVVLGLITWFMFFENKPVKVTTSSAILNDILLPDGTEVDLNKNSQLLYSKKFTGNTREVSLSGEAFFKVKGNKMKPFIIKTAQAYIKVTGTSFNIKAYPVQEKIIVSVSEGTVQIYSKNNSQKSISLIAGETGFFSIHDNNLSKDTKLDPNYNSWRSGILIFTDMKLSDAIKILNQYYNAKISIRDKNIGECRLSATFNKQPLELVLKMLEISFNINVIKKDTIILTGKGCL
jgi:ferric-dicitrate binding protein FerR (iron transport regulator)